MPAAHAAEAAVIRSHPEPGRSPRGEIRAGASDNYTAVLLLPTDCKEALWVVSHFDFLGLPPVPGFGPGHFGAGA